MLPEYVGSEEETASKTIEITEELAAWIVSQGLSLLLEHWSIIFSLWPRIVDRPFCEAGSMKN